MEPQDHVDTDTGRTTVYTLLGIADLTIQSPPANRGTATTPARANSNPHSLLKTINFDAPNPPFDERAIRRRAQAMGDIPSKPSTIENTEEHT